jgi:type II secretion system protein D
VRADPRTRQILVAATEDDQRLVEEMLKALDRPPTEDGRDIAVQLITLVQARADDVANILRGVYGTQNLVGAVGAAAGGRTTADSVNVTVDNRTNSIIIAATRDILPEVVNLTRQLEEGSGEVTTIEIVPLERANADQVRATLLNLLQSGGPGATTALLPGAPGGGGGGGPLGPPRTASGAVPQQVEFPISGGRGRGTVRVPVDTNKITITTDTRANSVLIKAPPVALPLLRDLVRQMDTTPQQENIVVRVVTLENADASATATTLSNVYNLGGGTSAPTVSPGGTGPGGGGPGFTPQVPGGPGGAVTVGGAVGTPPGQVERFLRTDFGSAYPAETGQAASLLYKTIRVTADKRTNSLLLVGDKLLVETAERIALQLDSDSSLETVVFVYPLKNANADLVAERVGTLLSAQNRQAGGAGTGAGGQRGLGQQQNSGLNRAQTAGGRTGGRNTTGGGGGGANGQSSVNLNNQASAFGQGNEPIAPGTQINTAGGADANQLGGSVRRILESEVQLVSDPDNNSVIVAASRRYADRVRELIRELDRQAPQVIISALIAEVTVNDTDEFGVQINVAGGRDSDPNAGPAQFRTADAPNGVFSGTVFANLTSATAGLTISGAGNDISYFVRALQSQGRLRVLSEPKILALNNQPAFISVGQDVPFPVGTLTNQFGNVQQQIQYRTVGIILEVIPHINPEGFIKLEVRQENSSLDTTRNIPVTFNSDGSGASAPVFNIRQAETIINVKDGETIVLGGLISDELRENLQKVPFLGDLPIIGLAFSSRTQSSVKSELLIIITPRVVRTLDEARDMTAEQKARYFLMDDRALNFESYSRRKRLEKRFDVLAPAVPTPFQPPPGAAPAPPGAFPPPPGGRPVPVPVPPAGNPAAGRPPIDDFGPPLPAARPPAGNGDPGRTGGERPAGPAGPVVVPPSRPPATDPFSTPLRSARPAPEDTAVPTGGSVRR